VADGAGSEDQGPNGKEMSTLMTGALNHGMDQRRKVAAVFLRILPAARDVLNEITKTMLVNLTQDQSGGSRPPQRME
jgi:hypothetical protein